MASDLIAFESLFKTPLRNGLTRPKAVRGVGTKMVNMGEIFAHGRIGDIAMDRVQLDEREMRSFLLEPGDLLFARQSLVLEGAGKCSIFLGSEEDVTFESHIIRTRIDCNLGNPTFFYYFFQSPTGRNAIRSIVEQVAAAGIRGSDLAKLDVPNVPLPTQDAIASILSALDEKIALNREMSETLEEMARTLFKSWFVDFDPVRAKLEECDAGLPKTVADLFPDDFQSSELGSIPKGWSTRAVYDCATFVNGLVFRTGSFSLEKLGLPVIKIGELKAGITSQTKFTTETFEEKYRVRSGDVLFSWSGSPDTSIDTFLWTDVEGWLNQHIFKVQFHSSEQKLFVYYLLRFLKNLFVEIARNKQTTGLGHVTADDMRRLRICWPPPELLSAFNRVVDPLFNKSYSCRIESSTLSKMRDTLLPKLISGELQIPHPERILGGQKP